MQYPEVVIGRPPEYALTGNFTVQSGRTLRVKQGTLDMRGVRLDVAGQLVLGGTALDPGIGAATIRMSNVNGAASKIVVGTGGVLRGMPPGGVIACDTGSEVFADGGVVDKANISTPMNCLSSCLVATNGGRLRFGPGTQTFTGGAFLAASAGGVVEVPSGAQLVFDAAAPTDRIQAGTRFRLGTGAGLTFGNSVQLVGTAAAPIRFERLTYGARWGGIRLEGDDSTLRHVVVDGGTSNLWVQADDVDLDYVTSLNGDHGLRTHFEADLSTASNLRVTNSRFENSTYYGLYLYSTNALVQNTVVRRSGWNGVNLYFASVYGFGGNTVENGTDAGIAVSEGNLSFSYASPGPGARNRVRNNAGHEVYVASGGSAFLGGDAYLPGKPGSQHAPNSQACSAITSTGGYGGSKLVYNATGQAVVAKFNWWGTSFPQASSYYGPVDRGYPLSSDPTAGGACGGGPGGPGDAAVATQQASATQRASPTGAPIAAEPGTATVRAEVPVASAARGRALDEIAAMAERMDALRDTLSKSSGDVRSLIADLTTVVRADPNDAAGRWALNVAALSAVAEPLDGGRPSHRHSAEFAAVSLAREALSRSAASEARALFDRYAPRVTLPEYRRSLLAFESGLLVSEGRPGEALTRLVAYEAAEAAHALVTDGYEAPDLSLYHQMLAEATERSTAKVSFAGASPALVASASALSGELLGSEPLVTGLGVPYPNPTRAGVSVALTLAQAGRAEVAVYDVTGRQVATLATGERGEGTHVLAVAGSGLAPGLYLVRATVSGGADAETFIQRFTVVR